MYKIISKHDNKIQNHFSLVPCQYYPFDILLSSLDRDIISPQTRSKIKKDFSIVTFFHMKMKNLSFGPVFQQNQEYFLKKEDDVSVQYHFISYVSVI